MEFQNFLQAHVRIHLLDTPYVCPDCGAVYSNIYFLSLHLINKCYHVYKVISNGCKFCLSRNMSPAEFVTHFEDTHITPVFKCSQCLTIFQTAADFSRHLGVSHKKQNVSVCSVILFFYFFFRKVLILFMIIASYIFPNYL